MINLIFSHRHETLLANLAADIAKYRARCGSWAPLNLVLPNPCVKQFVLEGLVKGLGVVANQKTSYLEGFWRRYLPRAEPPLRLLDRTSMQGVLLTLFQEADLLEDPELALVKRYLSGEPRGLKALQLSGEVARVFESYLLNRPDWAARWEQGKGAAGNAPEALEAWQRRLWCEVHTRLGAARERILTFPEYVAEPVFDLAPFPAEVFIFGLGPMAKVYHDALEKLGRRSEVWLYLWNPSREIWDDVRRQWDHPDEGDDPFHLETTGHLALQRWGRPGREHIRKVLQLAPTDRLRAEWEAPPPATLLEHLQHSIITLGSEGPPELPPVVDRSLVLHACTSLRREAEVVASAVWETVLADDTVRFSDLAVILPEGAKADYLDHLRVAFSACHDIPWVLADEGPSILQETAEAANLLLGLAGTELDRASVVAALTHPALRRRWDELSLGDVAEFCERAGIVIRMGADDTVDSDQAGGLWTWERGLRRMALGHFHGPQPDDGLEPPPAPPMDGAPELALFLRALLQDLRQLAGLTQSPRAWVTTLRTFLQTYLGHPGRMDHEDEHRALAQVTRALAGIGELELADAACPALAFREARVLVEEHLASLVADALGSMGRGVVVATHASLRGVPFHTRFLLGLGEGVFPRPASRAAMDLAPYQRRPGDISPSEQDRYLFLESLMSARQALVLSHVCRDALTREDLQPSPLILDLRDLLLPSLGAEGWEALQVHHPHHRHDLRYFPHLTGGPVELPPNHLPAARKEAEALLLGQSLRGAVGVVELPADRGAWNLRPEVREGLKPWLGDLGSLAPTPVLPRLRLSVARLRKWLECQIQGGAQLRLGMGEEDGDDPADLDREPLEAPRMELGGLRKEALWEAVAKELEPAEAFDRLHRAHLEAARMPGGLLFEGVRAEAVAVVEGWHRQLAAGGVPHRHRFGPDRSGRSRSLPVQGHPPLNLEVELDGKAVSVQLEGTTEPLLDGWSLLLSRETPPDKAVAMKDRVALLRSWLDHLLMAASEEGAHVGAQVVASTAKRTNNASWRVRIPDCTPKEARDQLGAWVTEALTDRSWALLPVEALLDSLDGTTQDPEAWLAKARVNERATFSSSYGPLPRVVQAEDLDPCDDWRTLADRRLGAFPTWSKTWETL